MSRHRLVWIEKLAQLTATQSGCCEGRETRSRSRDRVAIIGFAGGMRFFATL
jgi:hypothetical protein